MNTQRLGLPLLERNNFNNITPLNEALNILDDQVAIALNRSLADFGAVGDNTTDDAGAFSDAIQACVAAKGGVIDVPAGRYLISTTVVEALGGYDVTFRGVAGVRSQIRLATGSAANAFTLSSGTVRFEQIVFLGTNPAATEDFRFGIVLIGGLMTFTDCAFYGLMGDGGVGGSVIYVEGALSLRETSFYGCTSLSGLGGAVIRMDNYAGFSMEGGEFADYGTFEGVAYSKTAIVGLAWIYLQRPVISADANLANLVTVRQVKMDEGALFGFYAFSDPTAGGLPIPNVDIQGLTVNVNGASSTPETSGVYIKNAQRVRVRDSWFGYVASLVHYGVYLQDVGAARIENTVATANADRFFADSTVGSLEIVNCDYDEAGSRADLEPGILRVTKGGASSACVPTGATSSNLTLTELDHTVEVDATAGARTVTLPEAVKAKGREFTIINTSGINTVTVDGDGSETINGAATYTIAATAWKFVTVRSNGTSWLVVGAN